MANIANEIVAGNIADLSLTASKGAVLHFDITFPQAEFDLTGKVAKINITDNADRFELDSTSDDITINTGENKAEIRIKGATANDVVGGSWSTYSDIPAGEYSYSVDLFDSGETDAELRFTGRFTLVPAEGLSTIPRNFIQDFQFQSLEIAAQFGTVRDGWSGWNIINLTNPTSYNANVNDFVLVTTVTNTPTVNAPASPQTGDMFAVKNIDGAQDITIDGNGNNIEPAESRAADGTNTTLTQAFASITYVFDGTVWRVHSSSKITIA